MDEKRKKELMKLNPGELVLALVERERLACCKFDHGDYQNCLDLNLGILTNKPKINDHGQIFLPFDKHLERTIDYKSIKEFNKIGLFPHGFYSSSIDIHLDNQDLDSLYKEFNNWKEMQGELYIVSFSQSDFLHGEEIHKRFWNPNAFENQSGLDLSYVFALHRLGARIPKEMGKTYLDDLARSDKLKEAIEGLKGQARIIEEKSSLISSIFLRK